MPKEIMGATVSVSSSNPAACEGDKRVILQAGLGRYASENAPPDKVSDENTGGSRASMMNQQQLAKIMPLTSNATARYAENKQMPTQRSDSMMLSKGGKASATPVLPPLQKKAFANKIIDNSFSILDRNTNKSINRNKNDSGRGVVGGPESHPPTQILPPLYHPEEAANHQLL